MKKNQKSWSTNEMQKGLFNSVNLNTNFRANKKLIKITAKVTGRKLVNNGKYTEYNIFIQTEYNEWNIQKRYSEFDSLNQSLIKKIPEINQYFPPKRFFKNSEETIDERVKYFNTYLHKLFNNYDIFLFDEVIDFIGIDKKILELTISKHTMGNKDKENEPQYDSVKKSIRHLAKNERSISVDRNGDKKTGNILDDKIKSNGNLVSKRKQSTISDNLNINIEINAKNNNENIINEINSYNTEDFEDSNKNYFSKLLEYENSKKSAEDLSSESPLRKIIEEFLNNLNQKNDNKTAIIKSFEEFLKKDNSWPSFSRSEIISLFIGIKNYKKFITKKNTKIKKIPKNEKKEKKKEKKEKNEKNNIDNESIVRRAKTSKIINGKFQKNKDVRKSMGKQVEDDDSLSDLDSISSESNLSSLEESITNDLPGLFSLIGNYENNVLLSANCLDLLVKLLSREYNPQVDFYIEVLKGRSRSEVLSLKLEDLIISNIGGSKSTFNAFKLLSILFKESPNINQFKRIIIKNDAVFKRFLIFEKNYYD